MSRVWDSSASVFLPPTSPVFHVGVRTCSPLERRWCFAVAVCYTGLLRASVLGYVDCSHLGLLGAMLRSCFLFSGANARSKIAGSCPNRILHFGGNWYAAYIILSWFLSSSTEHKGFTFYTSSGCAATLHCGFDKLFLKNKDQLKISEHLFLNALFLRIFIF